MSRKCYIVGAGDNSGTNFMKKKNEYVIAADGGLEILERMGIKPDLVLGDFDSLGYAPEGSHVIRYPVEKDDTDMMLAVKKALEMGYDELEIFGGTGGRIDHTVANFQTMLYASRRGAAVKMTDKEHTYHVITDSRITLEAKQQGGISVFALGGRAVGVTIKGAKYLAEDMELLPDNPTAVSNSYIGKNVVISVAKGSLLIISD